MEDNNNKVIDEKVENFVIKELNARLKEIPEQYKGITVIVIYDTIS